MTDTDGDKHVVMPGWRHAQTLGVKQGCSGLVVHQLSAIASALRQACHQRTLAAGPAWLGCELCMSTECHLVGFYFNIHIPLKKKPHFFLSQSNHTALCMNSMRECVCLRVREQTN